MFLVKSMFSLVCIFILNSSCKYTRNSNFELSLATVVSQLVLVVPCFKHTRLDLYTDLICLFLLLRVFLERLGLLVLLDPE